LGFLLDWSLLINFENLMVLLSPELTRFLVHKVQFVHYKFTILFLDMFFLFQQYTGVIGAFNCQGGGWCRETRRNQCFSECVNTLTATTSPKDVEWNSGSSPISIANVEEFALFLSQSKKLLLSGLNDDLELTLEPFKFELITVSPVVTIEGNSVRFAPIGLVNMLNTSGAIRSLVYNDESVEVGVFGAGEFRVYASKKPVSCLIDGEVVEFGYEDSMVMVQVPWSGPDGLSSIQYLF